uniref:Uncharacterized protein n=1 Tax=Helianthus annuus TaxID=4232 RepID=A0A251TH95_HELAN
MPANIGSSFNRSMKILTSWFCFPAFIGILQHSSRDVDAGDCDIVQVIENNGDILKLLRLTHVGGGYKSVFKGGDRKVKKLYLLCHKAFFVCCYIIIIILVCDLF